MLESRRKARENRKRLKRVLKMLADLEERTLRNILEAQAVLELYGEKEHV